MPVAKEPERFTVRVQPNARKNDVIGFKDNILLLKITAPAQDGKANHALIVFLSEVLEIRKSDIVIEKGQTSKRKIIAVSGLTHSRLRERIVARSSAGKPKLI